MTILKYINSTGTMKSFASSAINSFVNGNRRQIIDDYNERKISGSDFLTYLEYVRDSRVEFNNMIDHSVRSILKIENGMDAFGIRCDRINLSFVAKNLMTEIIDGNVIFNKVPYNTTSYIMIVKHSFVSSVNNFIQIESLSSYDTHTSDNVSMHAIFFNPKSFVDMAILSGNVDDVMMFFAFEEDLARCMNMSISDFETLVKQRRNHFRGAVKLSKYDL